MANIQSAKKAIRQQKRKAIKNDRRRKSFKEARKAVEKAIANGKEKEATKALSLYDKALSKAAKHNGPLHKKTASRYLSRMAQKVKAAFTK